MLIRTCLVWVTVVYSAFGVEQPVLGSLQCEYRTDPLGIDAVKPRLGWIITSGRRSERQTAYQVLVASSPATLAQDQGDSWDSGKVTSDRSIQVEYAGKTLVSREHCWWKVRTWDGEGKPSAWSIPATWSMGLLSAADWKASWMGVDQFSGTGRAKSLSVGKAIFHSADGALSADVTAMVAALVHDGTLAMTADLKTLGGDPAPGRHKRLHLEYDIDGKSVTREVDENARLYLPDDGAEHDAPAVPRYLRKVFAIDQPVRRATAYVTALGLYELRLNAERVGDQLLAPEWTDYRKRVQYQTYDVTTQVRQGENAIGVILGNGWYCGNWQHWQSKLKPIYGDQPYVKVQIEIENSDGSVQTVVSDTSWRGTTNGPVRMSGIYEGETYDARLEMPGWDTADFAAVDWHATKMAIPAAGELVWQRSEPIRVTNELKPVSITRVQPDKLVIDLGQNIAGTFRLRLREPAGSLVTMRFNEVLNPDGTVYMDNLHAGHLSSGDRQVVRYTCRGGREETYQPRFTYLGYRYVEITGLSVPLALDDFTGLVFHTDMHLAGSFTCSNALVNRLAQNIQWSQRANTMGVPTDCCQRDERCGYTGDMNFFMPTAIYNFDTAAFFNKWLVDVCEDSQMSDGHFADHAPTYGPGDGWNVGWSDAGIICPWIQWHTYGDTQVIREHYAAMKRNLALLVATSKEFLHNGKVGNGDWLNLGGGATNEVIGTAYDACDFRLMGDMSQAIGETTAAAAYRDRATRIAEAFAKAYIGSDGRILGSSQTGFALAFTMDLVPAGLRVQMGERFVAEVKRFDWHLATGFIGTPRLLPALHLAGHDDVAYRLLLQETFPSWLFQVKNGATTMWERWDGWRPGVGFADSGMNSFNHYAFGAVGEYLFDTIGGISAAAPGFKVIRIQPVVGAGLTWAKTTYESIHGRIATSWHVDDTSLSLEVTIPANTSAEIHVPAKEAAAVREGGRPTDQADGVRFLRMEAGAAVYAVGSGIYAFNVR